MVSAKKIHAWFLKALEEPFFRAEMYRAEVLLRNNSKKERTSSQGDNESVQDRLSPKDYGCKKQSKIRHEANG
ncbi:MAG: hypothetical protein AB1556_00875 [Bacillota bacterium]